MIDTIVRFDKNGSFFMHKGPPDAHGWYGLFTRSDDGDWVRVALSSDFNPNLGLTNAMPMPVGPWKEPR